MDSSLHLVQSAAPVGQSNPDRHLLDAGPANSWFSLGGIQSAPVEGIPACVHGGAISGGHPGPQALLALHARQHPHPLKPGGSWVNLGTGEDGCGDAVGGQRAITV